jgi:chemotaxis protein MotB
MKHASMSGTEVRWGRRAAMVVAVGLSLMGLTLGGCNNKLKAENEALRAEQAELAERASAAEQAATQSRSQIDSMAQEKSRLQQELLMARQAPAPAPAPTPPYTPAPPTSDAPWAGGGGGGGSPSRPSRGERFEISGDVLFGPGQTTIKPEARRELDRVASTIRRDYSGRSVRVEGHTDSDPIRKSKWGSNQALSKARADSVRDYLASKGISRSLIETVGRGSSEPRKSKAASRRVEIVVVD